MWVNVSIAPADASAQGGGMQRWSIVMMGLLLGAGCAPTAVEPAGVYGVRTLPAGDGWAVRWSGEATARVDGVAVASPPGGPVPLDGARPHTVEVGAVRFEVPPRPGPCAPLRFVVLGDGRAAVDGVGPSAYWPGMLGEALALDPAFVLNTGDLVKNGEVASEWWAYLASLPPWPPMPAVRGNHDRGPLFYAHGLAPGELFGWTMGPVFVAGLDTQLEGEAMTAALGALDRLLGKSTARWRVVVLHRPVWSRGNHGSDEMRINHALVPILDRHGVDAVFAGHDHHYERFCSSVGVGHERRCVAPGEGTVYVVTGGAATFTNPVPGVSQKVDDAVAAVDAVHSRVYSGAKHIVEVVVEGDAMTLTARRTRTGNVRPAAVIDRVVLPARRAGACPR